VENDRIEENGVYHRTTDVILAAYLITVGYEIVKIQKGRGHKNRKATLVFDRSDELIVTIDDYFSKKTNVDALTFYENVRTVKSRINNTHGDY
jgi:hypothetical protein